MASRNWIELNAAAQAEGRHVCAGIDLKLEKLPPRLQDPAGQITYACNIIDAVAPWVGYIKPNLAFYLGADRVSSRNPDPIEVLRDIVRHANRVAPDAVVILDAKFGDIDATNNPYAAAAFDIIGADAVTLHPYMGRIKGMQPFLDRADKGSVVICRTSNAGGAEFQDVPTNPLFDAGTGLYYSSIRHFQLENGHDPEDGQLELSSMPLYEFVAHQVFTAWNGNGNVAAVAGGTHPAETARIREIAGNGATLLIPGYGAQGAKLEDLVPAGIDDNGEGIIVNNSSALTFASDGDDYAAAAAGVAEGMHNEITDIKAAVLAA